MSTHEQKTSKPHLTLSGSGPTTPTPTLPDGEDERSGSGGPGRPDLGPKVGKPREQESKPPPKGRSPFQKSRSQDRSLLTVSAHAAEVSPVHPAVHASPAAGTPVSGVASSPRASQHACTILPDDAVLAATFQGKLMPPLGLSRWEALPCSREHLIQVNDVALNTRLRDASFDHEAWQQAKNLLSDALARISRIHVRRLHVFLNAPHPLALWLGRALESAFRQLEIRVYQFDYTQKQWEWYLPTETQAARYCDGIGSLNVFDTDLATGRGSILSVEINQWATEKELRDLREHTGAARIRRLCSPAPKTQIPAGEQALAGVNIIFDAMLELRTKAPDEPIYLATSAPLAMIIGLGRKLPPTVFAHVWGCTYHAEEHRYIPALEATQGSVADAYRPRLQLIEKGACILYRFNGTLLEACGSWKEPPAIRQHLSDSALLDEPTLDFSRESLPGEVVSVIRTQKRLDIELHLSGQAAESYWELLRFPEQRGTFLLQKDGWTLTRVVAGRHAAPPRRPALKERVRILLVPSLDPYDKKCSAEQAESYLELHNLETMLRDRGADPIRLEYGADRAALEDALATHRPHILHWIGHGLPDEGRGWPGMLEVPEEGGTVTLNRTQIPHYLKAAGDALRLLVLGSCYAVNPRGNYGLPDALLEVGLDAVIGFRDPVTMRELSWFSAAFYTALLDGAHVRDALGKARIALLKEPGLAASFAGPLLCVRDIQAAGPLVERAASE